MRSPVPDAVHRRRLVDGTANEGDISEAAVLLMEQARLPEEEERMPMVHIVVTNYRTPNDLGAFLTSVQMYPPSGPWSLTIVNVSPQDGDMAVGERWADELGVRHIWFSENIGYGRACNEGACGVVWPDHEPEGVLAFFNADVVLSPGALDECAEALLLNPEWGVVGPRQIDRFGRITGAGIFGSLDAPVLRGWRSPSTDHQYSDVRDDAISVSGSAYFIRRSVWDDLRHCPVFRDIAPDARGAFLPTPHYYEETWVSYHAQAHGWKVVYWGQATITHVWHQASPLGGYAEKQMPESRRLFRSACDRHEIPHD